ncbi:MAG: hypothetical protein COU31_03810 [Candidatus Magasanikbacteria bacterium CG10_big_fil_rev_8_21_14_0_10_40_10]|uniref:IPT/TIG domain-containing protein n=1 Tax=Candidatus Magasanikbacteria bacterium CG10_big_fil_rev_8_21_14_0_10_40_10 TaxID=1974648 RepID=A0A2M6W386_9BACT|nr:MAG: hypothetical protein COU31_03810 [Candidatus Magasanikbacteria bacterium CG10_big_fil_rev_8_21_14_0_10_40_10]
MPAKFLKKIIIFSVLITIGCLFISAGAIYAQSSSSSLDLGIEQAAATGLPSTDIRIIVAKVIRAALGLLGIVAVCIIMYGGFVWMTAGGNEERVGTAKKILVNGVIGLVIILSSYSIASFVVGKLVEGTTGGSGGSGQSGGPNPNYPSSSSLYITGLFQGGQMCIRNVHPSITFNRDIDLTTVKSYIIRVEDNKNVIVNGAWKYASNTSSTIEFVATGDCGTYLDKNNKQFKGYDCFDKSTTYTLKIFADQAKDLKSFDGKYSLDCSPFTRGLPCGNVQFITGDGVDWLPPQIKAYTVKTTDPLFPSTYYLNDTLRAHIEYEDDSGLQRLNIYAGGNYLVTSTDFIGCQATGTVDLYFNTKGWNTGKHILDAIAYDWSMKTDKKSVEIDLQQSCVKDEDCAAGICINGKCIAKTMITGVSPEPKVGGAPGTYVSVSGYLFGTSTGKVMVKNKLDSWITAALADCGAGAWTDQQIIFEMPLAAATNTPIRVEASQASTAKVKYDSDMTNDNYGPKIDDFYVNNIIRPGLCSVNPSSGQAYSQVLLSGKNFGVAPGEIWVGNLKSTALVSLWTNGLATTTVPASLASGDVAIKLRSQNGNYSNGVKFTVTTGYDASAPYIQSIEPTSGAVGEYITIMGKNFGKEQGEVWFKKDGNTMALKGSFAFPVDCDVAQAWSDNKIIVKFPSSGVTAYSSNYSVEVKPKNNNASPMYKWFGLLSATALPKPAICSISPHSSPTPLPQNTKITLVGEYFNANPFIYFSQASSLAGNLEPNLAVSAVFSQTNDNADKATISVLPTNVKTGPVMIKRQTDSATSTKALFTIKSCLAGGKTDDSLCSTNEKCCGDGTCVANTGLCAGETKWSAYIWRFSTKTIPKLPRVLEWCEYGSVSRLPSPTPNFKYKSNLATTKDDDQYNVCRNALVTIDFNTEINNINIDSADAKADLVINECSTLDFDIYNNTCSTTSLKRVAVKDANADANSVAQAIAKKIAIPALSSQDGNATTTFVQLIPQTGTWSNDRYYQVVLRSDKENKMGISAGASTDQVYLAKQNPCATDDKSAYCFWFKTDSKDCELSKVIVMPYWYWTNKLAEPIIGLSYGAYGLSSQRCVMTDVGGYDWKWSTADKSYADIYGVDTGVKGIRASALANTVGVLNNDFIDIITTASTGTPPKTYIGKSPLTIDLTDPKVLDYWPNCSQACPNAEIGVKFNINMSSQNVNNGESVKLYRCFDVNCFDIVQDKNIKVFFSDQSRQILQIRRFDDFNNSYIDLDSDATYKVVLSSSSSLKTDPSLLYAAAELKNASVPGSPYSNQFSWVFKTKTSACVIDRIVMTPQTYTARVIKDRAVFSVQPYGAKDSCSTDGQKIDGWSLNWNWSSADLDVATVKAFSTNINGPYCNQYCVKKGSTISKGNKYPICGNNNVEAGEDCDPPSKNGSCSLDCRATGNTNATSTFVKDQSQLYPSLEGLCGNGVVELAFGETCDTNDKLTKTGCSSICLNQGTLAKFQSQLAGTGNVSSVCGDKQKTSGEDCDLGIASDPANPASSYNCASDCRHAGTTVSSYWCESNSLASKPNDPYGGFSTSSYQQACQSAISICGDGVASLDEDKACEDKNDPNYNNCAQNCLVKAKCSSAGGSTEGCTAGGDYKGSNLLYSTPSFCGDGVVGIGEETFCETANIIKTSSLINPWALVLGVGNSLKVTGTPPAQSSNITASLSASQSGTGKFQILCGFQSDAECSKQADGLQLKPSEIGLASNSCCYARPKIMSVYPGSTSTLGSVTTTVKDVCPNTTIEASFDNIMDGANLKDKFLLAKGFGAGKLSAPAQVLAPTQVDNKDLGNLSYVKFVGANVLAVAGDKGLFILQVLENGNLKYLSSSTTLNNIASLDYDGSYIYAIDRKRTMYIFDISKLSVLNTVSINNLAVSSLSDIKIYGKYAYLAANFLNLKVLDISSSTKPVLAGSYVTSTPPKYLDLEVDGRFAYVAAGDRGLQVLDITDLSKLDSLSLNSNNDVYNAVEIDSYNKKIYVAANNGLRAYVIQSNGALVEKGSYTQSNMNLLDVKVANGYVFGISNTAKTYIFEEGSNGNMNLLTSVPLTITPASMALSYLNNYAYIGGKSGLAVVDLTKYTLGCSQSNDLTSLLAGNYFVDKTTINQSWYKKVWQALAGFVKKILGFSANAANDEPVKWCAVSDYGYVNLSVSNEYKTSKIYFSLNKLLSTSTYYAVVLKDTLKDNRGVGLGKNDTKEYFWKFKTGSEICKLDSVTISPSAYFFNAYGATTTLSVDALNGDSFKGYKKIQPVANYYDWQYNWDPYNVYVSFAKATTTYGEGNVISAQNQSGEIDLRASAYILNDVFSNPPALGAQGDIGKSHITVFLCANPWPPKDLNIKGVNQTIFPFKDEPNNNDGFDFASNTFDGKTLPKSPVYGDGYFYFSSYYCADYGTTSQVDDLPYLRPYVQLNDSNSKVELLSATGTLKRWLFSNKKNNDFIGMQIFANPNHYTVEEWFNKTVSTYKASMQKTKVGIYDAYKDANNIYIDVLDYSPTEKKLYTNIYSFNINADATTETKNVYNQLLANFSFNTNLSNYGYCASDVEKNVGSKACTSDLDCLTGQICSAQVNKIQRNYQRLWDINKIQKAISDVGVAPTLESGSLLKGQSISTWSSWTGALGSALKLSASLPVDRINKLAPAGTCLYDQTKFCLTSNDCSSLATSTCSLHDSTTGWSAVKNPNTNIERLSFACNTTSLAYRYIFSSSTGYVIRGRFEDPFGNNSILSLGDGIVKGAYITNWYSDFVDKFLATSTADLSRPAGICDYGEEIASQANTGYCGDKIVNSVQGEKCDPPGKSSLSLEDIKTKCSASTPVLQYSVCANDCQSWVVSSTPCSSFAKCGNGKLEYGEQCDFGSGNGQYNVFCDEKCQVDNKPSKGWCGDGIKQDSLLEFCDYNKLGAELGYYLYNFKKENSCSEDCKNYGLYCGDGVVQSNYGEKCEGASTQVCFDTNSVTGTQKCLADSCAWGACVTTTPATVVSLAAGSCGNFEIDAGEQCDAGKLSAGGKNGVPCAPSYGQSCSWCTDACVVQTVEQAEWCGNGKIEGPEKCETDQFTNLYASATTSLAQGSYFTYGSGITNYLLSMINTSLGTNYTKDEFVDKFDLTTESDFRAEDGYVSSTFSRGFLLKTCADSPLTGLTANSVVKKGKLACSSCQKIDTSLCVDCGIDVKNGSPVIGQIANVLEPKSTNPLLGGSDDEIVKYFFYLNFGLDVLGQQGTIDLKLANKVVGCQRWLNGSSPGFSLYTDYNGKCIIHSETDLAYINSSPTCSATTTEPYYKMVINADSARSFAFPVYSDKALLAQPYLYDMILSPVIPNTIPNTGNLVNPNTLSYLKRPYDVRVVVSWVSGPEFVGGALFTQTIKDFQYNSSTYEVALVEGNAIGVASSLNYYSNNPVRKYWYHGYGKTQNNTRYEAFTLVGKPEFDSTSPETGRNTFNFYVRVPTSTTKGIDSYTDSGLKVEVYIPKAVNTSEWNYYRHFDRPDKVYYLSLAQASPNSTAPYWHVFNYLGAEDKIGAINNGLYPRLVPSAISISDIIDVGTYKNGKIVSTPGAIGF